LRRMTFVNSLSRATRPIVRSRRGPSRKRMLSLRCFLNAGHRPLAPGADSPRQVTGGASTRQASCPTRTRYGR
jgi:hypothetical protein